MREEVVDREVEMMKFNVEDIFDILKDCKHSEREHGIIERSVANLEHTLLQDYIISHSSDKSEFYSAITLGKEHLA